MLFSYIQFDFLFYSIFRSYHFETHVYRRVLMDHLSHYIVDIVFYFFIFVCHDTYFKKFAQITIIIHTFVIKSFDFFQRVFLINLTISKIQNYNHYFSNMN
jgi:hypothetical protein